MRPAHFITAKPNRQSAYPLARNPHPAGFSLIELMISITLGLLVLAAVTLVFVNSSRTRAETEKTSQQIENGRYATQLLLEDLRMAGYYGELDPTSLATPAKPDPCATDSATLMTAMAIPVQGYDGVKFTCASYSNLLDDWKTGTDILVLRRASTCVAGSTGCDVADYAKYTYLQINQCATNLGASPYLIDYVEANLTLTQKDCTTTATVRGYNTHIYFVTNNYKTGDGIPTLRMAELRSNGFGASPLVAGIEQFQVEYGIANIPTLTAPAGTANSGGAPTIYTANPDTYVNACGANCLPNWRSVTALKLHILARNTQSSMGFSDSHTYVLGQKADGTDNLFGYSDNFKRHAYTTVVRFNNVAGRLGQ